MGNEGRQFDSSHSAQYVQPMNIIFNSFLMVAITEMGDKTQLLAFVLASRFKKPWTILAGILVATILNHLLAAWVGHWVSTAISPDLLRYILSAIFILFAIWILIPDRDEGLKESGQMGAFMTTLVAFFLAEMGDKTQVATVALAAHYSAFYSVVAGTTVGMLIANVPAVLLGDKVATKVPLKLVHGIASALFAVLGLLTLFNVGALLP